MKTDITFFWNLDQVSALMWFCVLEIWTKIVTVKPTHYWSPLISAQYRLCRHCSIVHSQIHVFPCFTFQKVGSSVVSSLSSLTRWEHTSNYFLLDFDLPIGDLLRLRASILPIAMRHDLLNEIGYRFLLFISWPSGQVEIHQSDHCNTGLVKTNSLVLVILSSFAIIACYFFGLPF